MSASGLMEKLGIRHIEVMGLAPGRAGPGRMHVHAYVLISTATSPTRRSTWRRQQQQQQQQWRRGGSRSPLSSPCVMMIPPMTRVETPQLLWCTNWRLESRSRYWVPKALAKLVPRLCEVPA
ncbi:hypothetical protein TSOC_004203 [Tetrabaena socialis]|uniref:Uncharacterized protein n=1 Tax=Tetrabaena socialis TaxID=47790 RepID=A0A2J8A9J4_9CHLO|nr:hypothetical protein TSOC_004203 [Tetrabaena socialis]|eukprot:PNH09180.1 hypothetical protein TSOC_004203 [Tetrabaena socialis]